ncbi:alpha/beta hydrolase [Cognatiyoonia sp. IB215182]|uniref:alpha/beta hydrolase n=1 Tax=Cognatiyoonia sp. IB215182 TaxID=3097353 RepID=UPI002A13BC49|nr:alpha/beta hydrolase [Cognatiyoonia sp. IB215182]MDX8352465.1 alpha/beta hydrolase [Cognatiyoonia sp. IB215182]
MSRENYHTRMQAPSGNAPLIFALHGTGGDEHQFFAFAQGLVPGAGVISPRGDVSEMGAARFFRRTGEGVYDMDDLARATAKMAAFVEDWKTAFPGSPAYAFGYSNGANILAAVMMARPDLFARVGLMHPLIPWDPAPVPALASTRILITAGERDPIGPLPRTKALADWAHAQGARVRLVTHEGGHELRPEEAVALQEEFAQAPQPIGA